MIDSTPQISTRLRRIQAALGVTADGLLGPETLTAIETRLRITPLKRSASLTCSRRSLQFIVRCEVGSQAQYEQRYRRPVWPGGESGCTIGIGYDLGYASAAQIDADWAPWLELREREALLAVRGMIGAVAAAHVPELQRVEIPFTAAEAVFYTRTLPRFARRTYETFPGVQKLPLDAQGALLSLVFNRGTSLQGDRRAEMRAIRSLLTGKKPSLPQIADQFDSMQRLWNEMPGLQERRRGEAALVRGAQRRYRKSERVRV